MRLARTVAVTFVLAAGAWVAWQLAGEGNALAEAGSDATAAEPESVRLATTQRVPLAKSSEAGVPSDPRGGAANERARELAEKNREAVNLLDGGDADAAIPLFEQCVVGDPEEPVFASNLAEALARRAFESRATADAELRARARDDLDRAIELDPGRDDLLALRERWEKSDDAERDFWRKTTEHFELSFDGTRDELMWGTAPLEDELESAYLEFGELFGVFPVEAGRPRFRVVLYRPEAFGEVTGLDDWAAGAFDGTVRVPVANLGRETERLKTILRHELVHAFVHEVGGPHVPGWLNEGLAQLQERSVAAERQGVTRRAEERLRGRELFGLDDLAGSLASWTDRDKIELAYAQSLAFVAYLDRMHGTSVVVDLVAACKEGRPPATAFEEGVGVALDVVLQDMIGQL